MCRKGIPCVIAGQSARAADCAHHSRPKREGSGLILKPTRVAGLVGVACAAVLMQVVLHGREGSWYPLSTIIHRPQLADPAFGYRLLLPSLARAFEVLIPRATDHNAFIATQILVIAVMIYLCGMWTRLFLPRLGRPLGYLLATVMLVPTMNYWTFYDLAIVAFWSGCLLLLYYDRWLSYLIVFGFGVLNHENMLLLVPVAVLYGFGRLRLPRLLAFAFVQLFLYAGLRYAVIHGVHGAHPWDNHLRDNIFFWRSYSPRTLICGWLALVPWWLLAMRGWRYAPKLLRCGCIALPGLLLVAIVFGRIEETRLFDAFVPVTSGLIACWVREESRRWMESTAYSESVETM
jgi:hypothetical protein